MEELAVIYRLISAAIALSAVAQLSGCGGAGEKKTSKPFTTELPKDEVSDIADAQPSSSVDSVTRKIVLERDCDSSS